MSKKWFKRASPLNQMLYVRIMFSYSSPFSYAANQARAPDGSRLAPHLFTLADNAFRRCRALQLQLHRLFEVFL
jgi:hypothetical protein